MKRWGLLPRLIIAIILGIIIGKLGFSIPIKLLATFNGLFGNFLAFIIPLIIIAFIAPGIGKLGKGAGKVLGFTVLIAYCSTIFSGTLAYSINNTLFYNILKTGSLVLDGVSNPEHALATGYFIIEMPPLMSVMTALILAFIIGIGIYIIKAAALQNIMNEIQEIIEKVIKGVIIPLLPFYITGVFANMTYAGQIEQILSLFFKVFIVIIFLHITIILIQYCVAGALYRTNPFKLIGTMIPAYFTCVGLQSSAATIPVTLNQTRKNGVHEEIAEFVVPLCATIHLSGSTITLVSCSLALMILTGMPVSFGLMFGFILMLGVIMVAAPGVPGGGVMAALGILQTMLGFDANLIALMIALYVAQDSFGGACNVTGDGAIAIMVNKIAGHKLERNTHVQNF